jgi:hypothetical protein
LLGKGTFLGRDLNGRIHTYYDPNKLPVAPPPLPRSTDVVGIAGAAIDTGTVNANTLGFGQQTETGASGANVSALEDEEATDPGGQCAKCSGT